MTILDINIAKGIVITKYMTIYVTIHYNTKRILSYIVSIVTNCHVLSCIVNNIARVWFADEPRYRSVAKKPAGAFLLV